MKCPYCDEDMEQGFLRANGNLHWMPLQVKEPILYSREKYAYKGAVLFPPYWDDKHLHDDENKAFICRKCKKMVVDFPEE